MLITKLFIACHHILFLYGFYLIGSYQLLFFIMSGIFFIRVISEEIMHKGLSHQLYKPNNKFDIIWNLCSVLLCQGSAVGWCNIHRQHHTYTDTERDPQSVDHNVLLKVYLGLFKSSPKNKIMVKDLIRRKGFSWTHKHYNELHILLCVIAYTINPYLLLSIISPGIIFAFHGAGLINGFSHANKRPVNNIFLSYFITFSRELHLDHHTNPLSKKYSLFNIS